MVVGNSACLDGQAKKSLLGKLNHRYSKLNLAIPRRRARLCRAVSPAVGKIARRDGVQSGS